MHLLTVAAMWNHAHVYQVSSKLYRLVRKNAEDGDLVVHPGFRFPLCLPPVVSAWCDKMGLTLILQSSFVTLCYTILKQPWRLAL